MADSRDPMTPDGEVSPYDTDYRVGQDNIIVNVGPFGLDIHNRVFAISGIAVIVFVILTLVFQSDVAPLFKGMLSWLTTRLDWFFLSARWARCVSAAPSPDPITTMSPGFRCCLPPVWASA